MERIIKTNGGSRSRKQMAWGSLWQVESIKSMFLEKILPQFTIRGVACFKFFIHLHCVHELLSKVFSRIGSTSKVIYLVVGVCFFVSSYSRQKEVLPLCQHYPNEAPLITSEHTHTSSEREPKGNSSLSRIQFEISFP